MANLLHYRSVPFIFILLIELVAFAPSVFAEDSCSPEEADCRPAGEWSFGVAVGLGVRSNPLVDGKDIPLVILPSVSYYGEKFFIDNLELGYTLVDSSDWMLNLIATPSYDRVFFERWDIGNILVNVNSISPPAVGNSGDYSDNQTEIKANEIKSRRFSMLGGIEVSAPVAGGQFQLGLFKDISNIHSGSEARLAFATATSESGWQGTFGLTWKDAKMTDYYYGVDIDEVVDNRAFYQAGSSFNPFARLSWHQMDHTNDGWRLGLEYQKLDSSISESPLINKDYVVTFFIGKQYRF